MNNIRQIRELNKRELENGVSPDASWHADYRDTAYIYIGGLPLELSEGDIISIFSQFGEPTFVNLIRDKNTGKSRGFAFLKYEDQRSTDLAVDNLGGTTIMNRTLRVDHTRYKKDEKSEQETKSNRRGDEPGLIDDGRHRANLIEDIESDPERPMLKEERELASLLRNHDDEDPMKAFLVQEKKEEVSAALARLKDTKAFGVHNRPKKHHHRRSHKSRDDRHTDDKRYAQRYHDRS